MESAGGGRARLSRRSFVVPARRSPQERRERRRDGDTRHGQEHGDEARASTTTISCCADCCACGVRRENFSPFSALFYMRDTLLSAAGALSHPAHVTCTDTPRATRVIKVASHVTTARCIPPPSENGLSATHTLTATFSPRSGGRPSCNERGFGAPSSSVFAHTSASPDRGDTFKPKCGKWVSPSSSCQAGSRPKHVSLRHRGWRVGE